MQATAFKYSAEIKHKGRLELHVPLTPGARVIAFVVEETAERFADLTLAAQISLDLFGRFDSRLSQRTR